MTCLRHQQMAGLPPVDSHRNGEQLSVLGSVSHLSQDGRELESEPDGQYLMEYGHVKGIYPKPTMLET